MHRCGDRVALGQGGCMFDFPSLAHPSRSDFIPGFLFDVVILIGQAHLSLSSPTERAGHLNLSLPDSRRI